jgi:hypothetical protein
MSRPRGRPLPRKRQLPKRPNAEQLKKRAKDFLRRLRANDEKVLARFLDTHPTGETTALNGAALHDTQWVIAREYGFESFSKLIAHVDQIEQVLREIDELPPAELIERLAQPDWRASWPVESHLFQNMDVAMDAVLAGIDHPNPRVRAACARLMDHGGDDRCIEPLRRALADPVPKVRMRALHSLQCQRCKNEPLGYDVIPDMIRIAETDPDPKVRKAAIGGMGIQPANLVLVLALERKLEREPWLGKSKGLAKLLRHHMHACSLDELLDRIEGDGPVILRQAAVLNLDRHPPSAAVARRLEPLSASEPNEILRRCFERGLRHHASLG